MKTRLRDLAPYCVDIVSRVTRLGIIEILWEQEIQGGVPDFYCLGMCSEGQECESEAKCDLCLDKKIRWSGSAWDAQRGDSSRYIFRVRKIECTNSGGSPPGLFHAAWSCEGGGRILLLGVAIHRCLPKWHPHLPLARQPRPLRCNWRTTPAPGT